MNNQDNNRYFENDTAFFINNNDGWEIQKNACAALYKNLLSSSFQESKWLDMFVHYANKYERFLYSVISQAIINENSNENVAAIIERITNIVEKIKITDSKESNAEKLELTNKHFQFILKLRDHFNLAYIQRNAYNQTRDEIKNVAQQTFNSEFKNYEKDMTSQLLSLVAIFTALSFVIFGGISILDSLLENVSSLPIMRVIVVCMLWMLCMVNLFSLFAKIICDFTGRELKTKSYINSLNIILIIATAVMLCLIMLQRALCIIF